jgi:hypothetical protein
MSNLLILRELKMSEINENQEMEAVELPAAESVTPDVPAETPAVEEIAAIVVEPVAEVVEEVVAETVVESKPLVVEKKHVVASVVEEEFDWDAFEGKKATAGSSSKQSMTEMYDNTLSILQ